jgi:proteic killer suppression protein
LQYVRDGRTILPVINSFRNRGLERYFRSGDPSRLAVQNARKVHLILAALEAAAYPRHLDIPGMKFHSLAPGQPGRYSVWVTGNYRITFAFDGRHAIDVDLEDYH